MNTIFLDEKNRNFDKYQRLFVISMILFLLFLIASVVTIHFNFPILTIISASLMIISGIFAILIDRHLDNLIG